MQPPLQQPCPGEQLQPMAVQTPPMQVWSEPHGLPQPPQFFWLVDTSTQPPVPGQQRLLAVHAAPPSQLQLLPLHVSLVLQEIPQPLQFLGSLVGSTQVELDAQQSGCCMPQDRPLVPHTQAPATQTCPEPHARPQPLQLAGSLCRFLQPLDGQHVSEPAHTEPAHLHLPPEQVRPAAHTLPQLPQLVGLLLRLRQVRLLQQVFGESQALPPHAQLPVDVQPVVEQHSSPAPQALSPLLAQLHLLPTQLSPTLQAMPQPPQLNASLVRSTQPVPLQQAEPA